MTAIFIYLIRYFHCHQLIMSTILKYSNLFLYSHQRGSHTHEIYPLFVFVPLRSTVRSLQDMKVTRKTRNRPHETVRRTSASLILFYLKQKLFIYKLRGVLCPACPAMHLSIHCRLGGRREARGPLFQNPTQNPTPNEPTGHTVGLTSHFSLPSTQHQRSTVQGHFV